VSICESIASTVTAPEIDDEAPSSMDEDDDADSDTTSAQITCKDVAIFQKNSSLFIRIDCCFIRVPGENH
jgi:hypothetical protein